MSRSRIAHLLLAAAVILSGLFDLPPVAAAAQSPAGRDLAGFPGALYLSLLTGDQEVPPVATDALGRAGFLYLATGTPQLQYVLQASNLDGVTAAHIHCAPSGTNGPVGVTLYSGPGLREGQPDTSGWYVLARGMVAAPNGGNACGWTTLEDVANAMNSGDTYVNLHTPAHPGGEVRSQIMSVLP